MPNQDYSDGPRLGGDSYDLLEYVLGLKPAGFAVEFGVSYGTSLRLIAKHMPVVGFDSFQGLPEQWGLTLAGEFACYPPIVANSRLVIGLFADTLPTFDFRTVEPIGLVHIDCDCYSSTKTALAYTLPHLKTGCYIVFDDWRGYPPWDEEQQAFIEYANNDEHLSWTVIGSGLRQWAIQIDDPSQHSGVRACL